MVCTKPWWKTLLISHLLESIYTSATFPKPEICQLTDCSVQKLSPIRYPLCASTFDILSLRPIMARRLSTSRRVHRHLFDIFHNPKENPNCLELNFMSSLQDDIKYQSLHLSISCQGKGKLMFVYDSNNVWSSRCIKPIPTHEGMFQTCNYHAHEQLRFTALDNDTLLVEDLSSFAPPGTWMIFRSGAKREDRNQKLECRCRNLLRDRKRLERCIRHHQERIDNEERIRQVRERIVREFRIAVVVLVASCFCTVFMRCWATRQVTEFEYISNFVYA